MFKELMDLFEESIIITDRDMNILYVNQAFEVLFEVPFKDIENTHLFDLFADTPEENQVTAHSILKRENISFRNVWFNWNGREMVLRIQTKIHFDDQDHVEYVMTQIEDVTEDVKKREEREAMIKKMTVNIIPLTDVVGILPLQTINTDDQRDILIDHTLEQCKALKVRYLAVDLSSLHDIDDELASIIERLLSALKLLGVQVFISGIHPGIVPAITSSFTNLSSNPTYQTLHQAINELMKNTAIQKNTQMIGKNN